MLRTAHGMRVPPIMPTSSMDPVHLPIGGKLIATSLLALVVVLATIVLVIYFSIDSARDERAARMQGAEEIGGP